jgi:hypothetical protein
MIVLPDLVQLLLSAPFDSFTQFMPLLCGVWPGGTRRLRTIVTTTFHFSKMLYVVVPLDVGVSVPVS